MDYSAIPLHLPLNSILGVNDLATDFRVFLEAFQQ